MQYTDLAPETYKRLLTLKAVRRFTSEMVSAKNLQHWSFVVLTDPAQKEAMVACGDFMTPVTNAPMAIALMRGPGGYDFDTGRLAQNMMLAARALGLGTCLTTVANVYEGRVKEALNAPESIRIAAMIPVGYPTDGFKARKRIPVDEKLHFERFS